MQMLTRGPSQLHIALYYRVTNQKWLETTISTFQTSNFGEGSLLFKHDIDPLHKRQLHK